MQRTNEFMLIYILHFTQTEWNRITIEWLKYKTDKYNQRGSDLFGIACCNFDQNSVCLYKRHKYLSERNTAR